MKKPKHISTGIDILDRHLEGGILQDSSILVTGVPGVEDLPFVQQMFFSHLSSGGTGIYIVNNKGKKTVKSMMHEFDWDVAPFEENGKCEFIDCYSDTQNKGKKSILRVKDKCFLQELAKKVDKLADQMDGRLMVLIDSLSSMIDLGQDEAEVIRFTKSMQSSLKSRGANLVSLFTIWPYEESTIKAVKKGFDCVISLKAIEQKVLLSPYFSVEDASWIPDLKPNDIPYTVLRPGGIKGFIPKILVTGPFNAGKTSFIHSASTRAVSVQRFGTTIALDHGHVAYRGFELDLFGTPGQKRFDPILKLLGEEALGVIIVVDSTDKKSLSRVEAMLKAAKSEGIPLVVAANRADLKGALPEETIRKNIGLPEGVTIVPVEAKNASSCKKGLPCELKKKDVANVFEGLFEVML